MAIVSFTKKQIDKYIAAGNDKTDWERLRNMKDKDIVYDEDSPKLTAAELKQFKRVGRPAVENPKTVMSFRADKKIADVLSGLKNRSSLINDALRKHLIKLGML
jgi:uncharacterized protein (DUF4415 family)